MKKILFVGMTTNYGGVETYILNLFLNLDKKKYECYFPGFEGNVAYYDVLKQKGAKFLELPFSRRNYVKYKKSWMDALRKYKFDVIYFNTCDIISVDKLKFAKKIGVPVRIIHAHSSGIQQKMNCFHKISEKCSRKNLGKYATHFFACSKAAGEWMFDGCDYQLVCNGIDLDKYKYNEISRQNIRKKICIKNEVLIGCIGRLTREKNPFYSEKIAESILKENATAKFVFIGDGELKQEVQNIVQEKKLEERIHFIGKVDNVNEWMSALDCLVMPSLFEGLPFVLVEAQAACLPCIVSSTVSREADFTGLLQFIDLDAGEDVWAKTALEASERKREDHLKDLIDAGYSIENTAKEVREIIEGVEK